MNCPEKVSLTGGLALSAAPAPPAGGSDLPQNEPQRALTYKGVLGSLTHSFHIADGETQSRDGKMSLRAIQRVTAEPRLARGSRWPVRVFVQHLSLFGLIEHNPTDWVAHARQKCISHSLEAAIPTSGY